MDDVVCSECGGVPPKQLGEKKLAKKGWNFEGEYGPRCPICVKNANEMPSNDSTGLGGIGEVLAEAIKDKEE